MKRLKIAGLVILSAIMLSGCGINQNKEIVERILEDGKDGIVPVVDENRAEELSDEASKNDFSDKVDNSKAQKIDLSTADMADPRGIVVIDDLIYIADYENNCICVIDSSGNLVNTVGALGNDEDEFIHPTGIALHDNKIYVIDSGNNRIKILDTEMKYIDQVDLPDNIFDPSDYFTQIAIGSNGDIYVTGNFVVDAGIFYKTSDDKSFRRIAKSFYGSLYESEGSVYAVNSGNLFVNSNTGEFGTCAGNNYLWMFTGDQAEQVCEFPVGINPECFTTEGEKVDLLSSRNGHLMSFDKNKGGYVKSIYAYNDINTAPYEAYMYSDGEKDYLVDNRNLELVFVGKQ